MPEKWRWPVSILLNAIRHHNYMFEVLFSILSFIVVIGILVTFHEYGHFWVARKLGVKVTRFSIGFGKPLFRWQGKRDDTEYVIAQIPLGGYVKMLDERNEPVKEEELPYAFNRKPLATRMAVVVAGPLFNFILAVLVYWVVFIIGIEGIKPIIGEVEPASRAAQAGLQSGEQIIAVDEEKTANWDVIGLELIEAVLDQNARVKVTVTDADQQQQVRHINLQRLS